MLDEPAGRAIAEQAPGDPDTSLGDSRELRDGWYFSLRTASVGSNGLIVNKATGRVLHLGGAFPVERDLALYDRGYRFERYDLVVLAVHDMSATCRALGELDTRVVTATYEHGRVWRVGRRMTALEIRNGLEKLPYVLPALSLYFRLEVLEEARRMGWFDFEALEYTSKKDPAAW